MIPTIMIRYAISTTLRLSVSSNQDGSPMETARDCFPSLFLNQIHWEDRCELEMYFWNGWKGISSENENLPGLPYFS